MELIGKRLNELTRLAFVVLSFAGSTSAGAASTTLTQDFESESPGSDTLPDGWSLITVAGAPTYSTTAAEQGSDGSGGSIGLAGRVSSTGYISSHLPGAYLVNSTDFDIRQELSGSFDFVIVHEDVYDDSVLALGAVADGITCNTPGELLSVKFYEKTRQSSGVPGTCIVDGNNVLLEGVPSGPLVVDDTWHAADFTWTPTNDTTGTFSVTITRLPDRALIATLVVNGFTFDSEIAQPGFGSVNDTIVFDNVSVTGSLPPSKGTVLFIR